jgi:hypothetical protein
MGKQLTREDIEAVVRHWPKTSREASNTVMEKYGVPDEASDAMLV